METLVRPTSNTEAYTAAPRFAGSTGPKRIRKRPEGTLSTEGIATLPDVAARLKMRRLQLGLSQREVGAMVGACRDAYCHWENGDWAMPAKNIAPLALALQVTVGSLFGETGMIEDTTPRLPLSELRRQFGIENGARWKVIEQRIKAEIPSVCVAGVTLISQAAFAQWFGQNARLDA